MYSVPPDRAWWPAVAAPVERGVRPGPRAASRAWRSFVRSVRAWNAGTCFGDGIIQARRVLARQVRALEVNLVGIECCSLLDLLRISGRHAVKAWE